MKIHWDVEQGSADWYRLRSGVPTASNFHHILTPKKQEMAAARWKYAIRLIAERLLNWQADSLDKIQHIEDGRRNEPFAVFQLEEIFGITTRKVGFVTTNDGRFGASPDRLVMAGDAIDAAVEVKSPTIPVQLEYLLLGHEEAYRCQVQGQLWVAEADRGIFYAYNPRMPGYRIETGRDEAFIGKLHDALERFSDELSEMLARARTLGMFQAYATLATPLNVERGDGLARDRHASTDALGDIFAAFDAP